MILGDTKTRLYIDHVVLTISNLTRTKEFYSKIFGSPDFQDDYSIMFHLGETKLFFALPYENQFENDKFNPNRIGLEHLAIGIKTLNDLKEIENTLNSESIKHSGIHIDKHSKKEKIWLDDLDMIRLEFYIRP